ncbi:MAG TPA: hypothetical protein VKG92_05715, partial [Flavobacteriales bacterium]|nr:hypothetical protein [Flavobacteriales bacterium]
VADHLSVEGSTLMEVPKADLSAGYHQPTSTIMAERNEKSGTTPGGTKGTSGNMPGSTGDQRKEERGRSVGSTPGQGNKSYEQGSGQSGRQQAGTDQGRKEGGLQGERQETRQGDRGNNPSGAQGERERTETPGNEGYKKEGSQGGRDLGGTQGGMRSGGTQSGKDADDLGDESAGRTTDEDDQDDKPM